MHQVTDPEPLALRLHKEVLRLRLSEMALAREYKKQTMRTPCHFGVGQEAVAVGVCQALELGDAVYSHHRCHNHYLARGGSLEKLAAELYGREGGCSGGRGGSVHLTARDTGFIASTAILGQCISLAAGSALAFKMDKKPNVAVAFFGEGAGDEGVMWETFNYASLNKLPVIFVCENNGYATETKQPKETDLCRRARAFGLDTMPLDGNDVIGAHQMAGWARVTALTSGPVFLECFTYRWLEHVGPNYDHESGRTYRTKAEFDEWWMRDPVPVSELAATMDSDFGIDDLRRMRNAISLDVDNAIEAAKLSPFPTELMADVW